MQDWCKERGFADGTLVHENKLIMFLRLQVLDRELRLSHHKRARTMADGTSIKQTLGRSAIKGYVNAIISLWEYQSSAGQNLHPHPRGTKLKALLKNKERQETVRKREQFVDRGVGTMLDGYNEKDMVNIVRACWTEFSSQKHYTSTSVESWLRTAVDFLFSHNMLLRGESRRYAEFADLFTISLKNEGPTPCPAMILIMDNGKMNPYGRLEYGGVVRHKNPLLCTLSNTAFYLFYRWNCIQEEPPRFQQRQQWYNIHLIQGGNRERPISYEVQLQWTNKAFQAAHLQSLRKTHAGRSEGAKQSELNGTAEGQIRRGGRWNTDALTNCYLSNLPQEFIRGMADFDPNKPGNYYLPRAKILPPQSLVRSLWPWVDQWLRWFAQWQGENIPTYETAPPLEALSPLEEDRKDLAAQGFLQLLVELRTILLQDSVLFRKEFPSHPLWHDPLFVREDYLTFAQEVEASLGDIEEPEEIRLRQIVPDISIRLDTTRKDVVRSVEEHGNRNYRLLDSMHKRLEDLFAGRVSITIHGNGAPSSSTGPPALCTTTADNPNVLDTPDHQAIQPLYIAPPAAEEAIDPQPLDPDAPAPTHQMSRTISTVPDLYKEWTFGLGSAPAIQALEDAYGARWRPSQAERVFFSRRKVIISEIQRRQAEGEAPEAVAEELDLVRRRMKTTLNGLQKWLVQMKARDLSTT
jgi:Centromere DNA-binding protein complex CBF3 subunit, domain 2/Transcriptional activator of glycolytic enzymes